MRKSISSVKSSDGEKTEKTRRQRGSKEAILPVSDISETTTARAKPRSRENINNSKVDQIDLDLIPALDIDDEVINLQAEIAAPPNLKVNRYKTILEIDREIRQAESADDDIPEIELLKSHLSSSNDLKDNEGIWDWDKTFVSVMSKLKTIGIERITANT